MMRWKRGRGGALRPGRLLLLAAAAAAGLPAALLDFMSAACTCEQLRSDNEGYVSRAQHQPQPVELAAASLHEQLRMVARLVELSTDNQRSSPSVGVPLCEDCASGVVQSDCRRPPVYASVGLRAK